ncbi:MAG: SH3 domain-containing protein [Clostridia bacterium]|nr:SH3 domain-containing protein [Clostridia bacterium]
MKKTIVKHKKRVALAAAAMMLTAGCALAQSAVIDAAGALSVHAAPDQGAAALGSFLRGTKVEILGDAGGGWSQIAIGTGSGVISGYAMTQYLSSGVGAADTYEASVASPYGTQSVVLRDKASNSYRPVAMLMVGERVLVIGQAGEFRYVQTGSGCVGCLLESELK